MGLELFSKLNDSTKLHFLRIKFLVQTHLCISAEVSCLAYGSDAYRVSPAAVQDRCAVCTDPAPGSLAETAPSLLDRGMRVKVVQKFP